MGRPHSRSVVSVRPSSWHVGCAVGDVDSLDVIVDAVNVDMEVVEDDVVTVDEVAPEAVVEMVDAELAIDCDTVYSPVDGRRVVFTVGFAKLPCEVVSRQFSLDRVAPSLRREICYFLAQYFRRRNRLGLTL